MPRPLQLMISDADVNALSYMLGIVCGALDSCNGEDQDYDRARMLLARMDDAVNRYVKANQIPPTPQFEPLDTFRVHKESEAHRLKKVMGIIGKMHRVRYEQRRDLTYSDTVVHLFVLGPDMQKVRAKLRGLVK